MNGVVLLNGFDKIFLISGLTGNDDGGFIEWHAKAFRTKEAAKSFLSDLEDDLTKNGIPLDWEYTPSEALAVLWNFKDERLHDVWTGYGVQYVIEEVDIGD